MLNEIGKVMMYFLLYETLRDFVSADVLEGGYSLVEFEGKRREEFV